MAGVAFIWDLEDDPEGNYWHICVEGHGVTREEVDAVRTGRARTEGRPERVRQLFDRVRDLREQDGVTVLLVNIDEIWHADTWAEDAEVGRLAVPSLTERARQNPIGWTANSNLLKYLAMWLLGGWYMDGNDSQVAAGTVSRRLS